MPRSHHFGGMLGYGVWFSSGIRECAFISEWIEIWIKWIPFCSIYLCFETNPSNGKGHKYFFFCYSVPAHHLCCLHCSGNRSPRTAFNCCWFCHSVLEMKLLKTGGSVIIVRWLGYCLCTWIENFPAFRACIYITAGIPKLASLVVSSTAYDNFYNWQKVLNCPPKPQ